MSEFPRETVLRRERIVVGTALTVLTATAWLYLLRLADMMPTDDDSMSGMPEMSDATMAMSEAVGWTDIGALTVMWAVTMIAIFATVRRRRVATCRVAVPTVMFVLGYLAVWTAFSVLAAVAQMWLHWKALFIVNLPP